jgi:hypothetical protein
MLKSFAANTSNFDASERRYEPAIEKSKEEGKMSGLLAANDKTY